MTAGVLVTDGVFLATLIAAVLRASTPIVLAALGGLVSELAGSTNVALEGLMLVAAFFGVAASALVPLWLPAVPHWMVPWLGCGAGVLAAVILALVLAVFHLAFGADLIVAGVGINILAAGLTVLLLVKVAGDKGSTASLASASMPTLHVPFVDRVPILGTLVNGDGLAGHSVLVYGAGLAGVAVHTMLYRTAFGLRLRSVGENPEAARQAGVSVPGIQYAALAISGALAGLGGCFLSMGYLTLFQADMTAGRGYVALAAVFLGGRRPFGTVAAALAFGGFTVFAAQLGALAIPSQIVLIVPPLVTIGALVAIQSRRRAIEARRVRVTAAALLDEPARRPLQHGPATTPGRTSDGRPHP